MATVPTRPPHRTGAVAVDARKRRPPIWLWLLLLLLALLLLAWLLFAIFHKTHHKKTSTGSAVASTAPSTAGTASPSSPGVTATPAVSPSALTSTSATAGAGVATSSYGAALIGGGAVAAVPATGTEAAAASSAAGSVTATESAAAGPQGTVLFASDSAVIDPAGWRVIEAAAVRIKALHPAAVTVAGYTDVVGGQPKNVNLSQQRADAVARVLRQDLGTATPSITAVARGEADPISTNSTSAGRQQNRRASIASS